MVNSNILSFALLVSAVNIVGRDAVPRLLLTVYYESNCRDSRSFVLQQLRPAMRLLQEHVRMQFVPFGKAMSIDYGFGGFDCQHGQPECFGNMVQDCTLELMRGRTDGDRLEYVACELGTYAASKNSYQCVQKAKVQPEKVQYCVEFGRGTALQLNSEYLTSLVDHKFVPTITINNVFDQRIQDAALRDLLGTLCTYLQDTRPCSSYYNSQAWSQIMQANKPSSSHKREVKL